MKINLYTDGASRGNPGHAGIGVVALDESGSQIDSYYEYIGHATNNVAEYRALISGLVLAQKYLPCSLNVFMDSELLVNQMKGLYKVISEQLAVFNSEARVHTLKFEKVVFEYIPREKNKAADKLANLAIDSKSK